MKIDNISFNDLVVPKKDQDDSYEFYLERIISRLQKETIERLIKEFKKIKHKKGDHYLVFDYLRDQYLIANKSYWYEYVHYHDMDELEEELLDLITEDSYDTTKIRGIIYSLDFETLNHFETKFNIYEVIYPNDTFHLVYNTIVTALDFINANKINKIAAIGGDNITFEDIHAYTFDVASRGSYIYLFSTLKLDTLEKLIREANMEKVETEEIGWLIEAIGNEIYRKDPSRILRLINKENFSFKDFFDLGYSSYLYKTTSFKQIVIAYYLDKSKLEEFISKAKNKEFSERDDSLIYILEERLHHYDDKTITGKRFNALDDSISFDDLLLDEQLESRIDKVVQIYDYLKFVPNIKLEELFHQSIKNQFSPIKERRLLANRIIAEYIRRNPSKGIEDDHTHHNIHKLGVNDLIFDKDSFDSTSYYLVRYRLINYLDNFVIAKILDEISTRENEVEIDKSSLDLLKRGLKRKLKYLNKLYVKEHECEITLNDLVVEKSKSCKFTTYDQDYIICELSTKKIESLLDESRLIKEKNDEEIALISKLHAEYRLRKPDVYKASYFNNHLVISSKDFIVNEEHLDKYNYIDQLNILRVMKSFNPEFSLSYYFQLPEEQRTQIEKLLIRDEYRYENDGYRYDLFYLQKLKTCNVSDIVNEEHLNFFTIVAKFNIRKINKLIKELDAISKERESTEKEKILKDVLDFRKEHNDSIDFDAIAEEDEIELDEFDENIYTSSQNDDIDNDTELDITYLKYLERQLEEPSKRKKNKQIAKMEFESEYLSQHALLNKMVDGPFDYYQYPFIRFKEEILLEPLDYFEMHNRYLDELKENFN